MLKTAPNAVDVQDLKFQLQCRLKIFENATNEPFSKPCSALAAASRLGLIFIATNSPKIQIIQVKAIEELSVKTEEKTKRKIETILDYPLKELPLPSNPLHISINCDQTVLAVIIERGACPTALFYETKSILQENAAPIGEVRMSPTPRVHVVEVGWNPSISSTFTACKSDGTLAVYELKSPGFEINELPAASGATCFCWSPKGKQIAVGSKDGKITQYKPDLKAVKVIGAPPLQKAYSLISMQWISNYQFIGVYKSANPDDQACVVAVDAPKVGEIVYTNYDDICYSNGTTRPAQFYMILQQNWNVLMMASSNSMEVGVLGNAGDAWIQWIMDDSARAELPLSSDHKDTLPIGVALDTSSTKPIIWGESTLSPAPILFLLSNHGVLCCYYVINLINGAASVCAPADQSSIFDAHQFKPKFMMTDKIEKLPSSGENSRAVNLVTPSSSEITKVVDFVTPSSSGIIKAVDVTPPTSGMIKQVDLTTPKSTNQANLSLFGGQVTLTPIVKLTNQPKISESQTIKANLTKDPKLAFGSSQILKKPDLPINAPIIEDRVVSAGKVDDENNEVFYAQMVREECVFLESEIKALLHRNRAPPANIGTDAEMTEIVRSTADLDRFLTETVDVTCAQNAEVHVLKQNLLQALAWYEDAQSRYKNSQNPSLALILRSQPLDPISEKHANEIHQLTYYLESQLRQAGRVLDEQWEKFQDFCKDVYRTRIPTMELIFQTMVKQNATILKQRYLLKDISSRIKIKSRSSIGSSLLLNLGNLDELDDELKRLRLCPDDLHQLQCERVANKARKLTRVKVETLRNFLKNRDCPRVSLIKPQWQEIQSIAESKLSSTILTHLDAAKPKSTVPDFVHSTPKVELAQSRVPKLGDAKITFSTPVSAKSSNPGQTGFGFGRESLLGQQQKELATTQLVGQQGFSLNQASLGLGINAKTVGSTTAGQANLGKPAISTPKVLNFGSTASTTSPTIIKPTPTSVSSHLKSDVAPSSTLNSFGFGASTGFTFLNIPTVGQSQAQTAGAGIFISKPVTLVSGAATQPLIAPTSKPFNLSVTASSDDHKTVVSTIPASVFVPISVSPAQKPTVFGNVALSSTAKTASSLVKTSEEDAAASTAGGNASIFGKTKTEVVVGPGSTSGGAGVSARKTLKPIFGLKSETAAVAGSGSIFGNVQEQKTPIFGAKTDAIVATTAPSGLTAKTDPKSSVFEPTSDSFSSAPIFKNTVKPSIFDVKSDVSGSSIFGSSSDSKIPIGISEAKTDVTAGAKNIFGGGSSEVKSLFGTKDETPSVFAKLPETKPSASITSANIFGAQPTPNASMPPVSSTQDQSLFGNRAKQDSNLGIGQTTQSAITTSAPPIFGSPVTTSAPPSFVTTTPIFGTVTTTSTPPSFGSTSAPPIFGSSVTSAPPTFGSASTTSQPPIFGAVATSSAPSSFGSATTASVQPIFESALTTSVSPSFGSPTTTPFSPISTATSTFGTTTTSQFGATPTTQFGTMPTTQFGPSPTKFGTTPTTQFATAPTATFGAMSTSQFGAAPTTQFGSSLFGNASTSSSAFQSGSIFGNQASPSFGGQTSAGGGGSVFGQAGFGSSGGSVFGNNTTTTNVFGNTPTSSTFGGGSVFGGTNQTSPGFGSPVTTAQTSAFSFATAANKMGTTSFGFGGLNVGSSSPPASAGFGQSFTQRPNPFGVVAPSTSTDKSIFGGAQTTTSSSVFGAANSQSVFGGGGTANSQGFGFGGGGQTFGQQSGFGQSSFGGFGNAQSGPFSGGSSGAVGQSGFGAAPAFQKTSPFGAAPVFGGNSPAFGAAPSFGGSPTFGNPSTFGSPNKVFGASPTSGFGSTGSDQAAGFGNLANQNTVGFGNLAQQATTPQIAPQFSGNSSFSNWR